MTDYAQVEQAVRETIDALGQIDIMVNNAGIAGANAPVHEYPLDEWKRVVDIDLHGVFHCCRAAVPHMTKRGLAGISTPPRSPAQDAQPERQRLFRREGRGNRP